MNRTIQLLTDMWNRLQNEHHSVVTEENYDALKKAIKALERTELKPSYNSVKTELDVISRQDVVKAVDKHMNEDGTLDDDITCILEEVPPVTPQPKVGRCKDCKYFEYDSVAKVNGMSLVVAHEICSKWGNGCKTRENGYCFLYEPQESDHKCHTCKHYTSGERDGSCGSYICEHYSNWESEDCN